MPSPHQKAVDLFLRTLVMGTDPQPQVTASFVPPMSFNKKPIDTRDGKFFRDRVSYLCPELSASYLTNLELKMMSDEVSNCVYCQHTVW